DAVGLQTGPPLEAAERAFSVDAKASVERGRGKAVPGEQELERRDVPAGRTADERSAAEGVQPVPAEGEAGADASDPVHRKSRSALEAPDRRRRGGTSEAVDRARVEAARVESDLERGDSGIAGR